MTAVFISHASADAEHAKTVKVWLKEQGFENVFLDLDKVGGIGAGENWERRLYEEVARCHAVILIVTSEWLNSKWCFAEFSMARSLGKVIFPILRGGEDISVIGPELGSIQAEQWNEVGRSHLAERLNSVAYEIARGHRYSSARPPYPGFMSFEQKDAAIFFGRDPEIRAISERLEARRVQGGAKMLMVVGPSGSGKSSVVKAGVLPWISRSRRRWIVIEPFRPGNLPIRRLAEALSEATGTGSDWRLLHDRLLAAPGAALSEIVDLLSVGSAREATILITIDQFEESFTQSGEAERSVFFELLSAIGKLSLPILILSTARSDLMGEILKTKEFAISHEVFTLGKLAVERLYQVIEGPAQVAAIQLEKGLAQRIIKDAINADALPLLAFALRELYDRFGGDGRLTILRFEALGDPVAGLSPLENAIRKKAEDTIAAATLTSAEVVALKETFVSGLVTVNDEGVRLRRAAMLKDLPKPAGLMIQRLIEARLLLAQDSDGERVIEVAHEALFRAWPQLTLWLDEEQDFLIGRRKIREDRNIWATAPAAQKSKALLSGLMLEKVRKWTTDHPARLAEMQDFVEASIREEDAERAKTRRRQVALLASSSAAAAIFAVLALAAALQWSRAENAAEIAAVEAERARMSELAAAASGRRAEDRFALALGAVSAGMAADDPRLALYLAGEAIARTGDRHPGYYARAAILNGRLRLATEGPYLLGGPIPVGDALSIALSPNGSFLAVGDRDGWMTMIDTATREAVSQPISAHSGGIVDIVFDTSGQRLASVGYEGDVRLWHVEDGMIDSGEVLAHFRDTAWSVAFDHSGTQLAASGEAGEIQVWQLGIGMPVTTFRRQQNTDILSVTFSPDGLDLLAGTGRGEIFSWNIADNQPVFPPITDVYSSDVWQILFSPSGDQFATAGSYGSSALIGYPGGRFLSRVFETDQRIQSIAFSQTGAELIGGSEDGRLHLRDLTHEAVIAVSAVGHVGRIMQISLSDDGKFMTSLGRDQSVRQWTLFDPVPLSRDFSLSSAAKGVTISHDGTAIAAADITGQVYFWQGVESLPRIFSGHNGQVWALALSPDERQLASADRAGEIRIWDTSTGTATILANASDAAVWWVGFTPDGSRLVVAGDNGAEVFGIIPSGTVPVRLSAPHKLTSAAISPNGALLATTGANGTVAIIDLTSGATLLSIEAVNDIAWNVAFNQDGNVLAVAGSDEVVSLWNANSGANLAKLSGHMGGATDLAFLSDDATLAVTDRRGNLHFWDLDTQKRLVAPFSAHSSTSWRLATSASGNRFVTSGDDGQVRLWDILDPSLACELGAPTMDSSLRNEYFGQLSDDLACTALARQR